MTASKYWRQRDLQNATKLYEYSNRQAQLVTRWFSRAAKDMDAKIRDYYRKYAANNQLTYQQAKEPLHDKTALFELQENYEKLLAVAPSDPVVNSWLTRLHTAKTINRQEYLKAQLDMIASEVYGQYAEVTAETVNRLFEECYYKSLFDQQQLVGFGSGFNRLSMNFIQAATGTAWSGKSYSQRIWGEQRVTLARYMNRIITTGVLEGNSNQMMSAQLQKAMSTSAYNARRLIRTEGSYAANRGSLLGYREFGTEQYEFLATLDFKTSTICRGLDGRVFDVADAQPGVNMPPMHPFCRSTTVPYVPDEEFDATDTRAARNGAGETYRVPASMKYPDWYKAHVAPFKEELLAEKKYKAGRADAAQWQRYRERIPENAPGTLDKFQTLKYTGDNAWGAMKATYRGAGRSPLTYEEEAALLRYVSGESYLLNAKLRGNMALTPYEQGLCLQLDAALKKLPVFEGAVTRSMVMDRDSLTLFMKGVLPGNTLSFPSYTSTSVLEGYHESPTVLLRLISHTGRDAREINETEGEVLFGRDANFRVDNVYDKDGVIIIEAEEIV